MGRHAAPTRALPWVAALLSASLTAAAAASLGGLTSDQVFVTSNTVAAHAPTVVMADSFTTASGMAGRDPEQVGENLWREVTGRWIVRNGYLDPPMSANALVMYPAGLHELRVEVAVTVTSAHNFGLVVRGGSVGPSYLVASVSSNGQVAISKTVAGTTSLLAAAPFVAPVVQFTLSLVVVGSTLELRSNGVLLVAHSLSLADAAAFASLTDAGLWVSSSGNERLDDFRITTVT